MKTATTTETATTGTPPCPAWCTAPHDCDSPDYREHRSTPVRPTHGLYAVVRWVEPITDRARYLGSEPRVYFSLGDAAIGLSVRQATDQAAVMTAVGQDDAAELLRDMVTLIEDGGAS